MTTSSSPESPAPSPRIWSPTGDDHLIFQWVKMEGKTQSTVASMFGINQSTVSRIVQRYERWQSHMKDRENGRLDPRERCRAQRWLTYERNELILASCLRIAGEMEGFTELSKSVTQYPTGNLHDGRKIRTEERVTDRHGIASRFLRLAFRINMEQLKLADEADDRRPEPLSAEEQAEEIRQAATDAAELAAARQRAADEVGQRFGNRESVVGVAPVARNRGEQEATGTVEPSLAPTDPSAPSPQPPAPALAPLHNLHNENAPEIAPTSTDRHTCVLEVRVEKNAPCTCIIDGDKVGRSVPERPAPPPDLPLANASEQRMVAASP
jgi:transposase